MERDGRQQAEKRLLISGSKVRVLDGPPIESGTSGGSGVPDLIFPTTRVLLLPAAQSRITRARCASACAVLARRVQRSNVSRSSALIVNGRSGRPVRTRVLLSLLRTRNPHNLFQSFRGQDTSKFLKWAAFNSLL